MSYVLFPLNDLQWNVFNQKHVTIPSHNISEMEFNLFHSLKPQYCCFKYTKMLDKMPDDNKSLTLTLMTLLKWILKQLKFKEHIQPINKILWVKIYKII